MSFWVGIAEGFKDAEAANERQMERDYRLEQDKKSDERYQAERDYRTERDSISDQRYEQQRQDQLDALRIERMIKLGIGSPSTGGTGSGGRSKTDPADELVKESLRLQDRIDNDDNAGMEVAQWFESVDPTTRAAAMGFIRSYEADMGKPYDLSNLVDDFRVISRTGGNEDEIRKLIETGELDVANADDFIEAMQKVKPLLVVTSVPEATTPYDTADAQRTRDQVTQIVMERIRTEAARNPGTPENPSPLVRKLQEFDAMENPENARIALLQYAADTGILQGVIENNPVYSRYRDQFDPFLMDNPLNAPIGGGMVQESTQTQANPQQDAMVEPTVDPVVTQTEQATREAPTPQTEEEAFTTLMTTLDSNEIDLDMMYEVWATGEDLTAELQEADAAANVPAGTTLALLESIKLGKQEENASAPDEFSGVDMSTDGVARDAATELTDFMERSRQKNIEDGPAETVDEFSGVDTTTDGEAKNLLTELVDFFKASRKKNKADGPAEDAPSEFDETSLVSDKEDELDVLLRKTEEYLKGSSERSKTEDKSNANTEFDGVSKDRIEQLPSVLDDLEDEDIRSITQTVLRQDTDMYQELLDKYSVEELDEIVQKGMILLYG